LDRRSLVLASAQGVATVPFSIIVGTTFGSQWKLNKDAQAANSTTTQKMPTLSKRLEPFWRTSKSKEAHQSIRYRQSRLVQFYPTFRHQSRLQCLLQLLRTVPSMEVRTVTHQSLLSGLRQQRYSTRRDVPPWWRMGARRFWYS
jgi:hypothetical protein